MKAPIGLFQTSVSFKISKNLKGDPLATNKFRKKSRTEPDKIERGPFGDIKNFSKNKNFEQSQCQKM